MASFDELKAQDDVTTGTVVATHVASHVLLHANTPMSPCTHHLCLLQSTGASSSFCAWTICHHRWGSCIAGLADPEIHTTTLVSFTCSQQGIPRTPAWSLPWKSGPGMPGHTGMLTHQGAEQAVPQLMPQNLKLPLLSHRLAVAGLAPANLVPQLGQTHRWNRGLRAGEAGLPCCSCACHGCGTFGGARPPVSGIQWLLSCSPMLNFVCWPVCRRSAEALQHGMPVVSWFCGQAMGLPLMQVSPAGDGWQALHVGYLCLTRCTCSRAESRGCSS